MAGSPIIGIMSDDTASGMSPARGSATAVSASSSMASSAMASATSSTGPCNKLLTDERNTKKSKGDNKKEL